MVRGFTLIELLIVVAVIGILASFVIPQLAHYRMKAYMEYISEHKSDIKFNEEPTPELLAQIVKIHQDKYGRDHELSECQVKPEPAPEIPTLQERVKKYKEEPIKPLIPKPDPDDMPSFDKDW